MKWARVAMVAVIISLMLMGQGWGKDEKRLPVQPKKPDVSQILADRNVKKLIILWTTSKWVDSSGSRMGEDDTPQHRDVVQKIVRKVLGRLGYDVEFRNMLRADATVLEENDKQEHSVYVTVWQLGWYSDSVTTGSVVDEWWGTTRNKPVWKSTSGPQLCKATFDCEIIDDKVEFGFWSLFRDIYEYRRTLTESGAVSSSGASLVKNAVLSPDEEETWRKAAELFFSTKFPRRADTPSYTKDLIPHDENGKPKKDYVFCRATGQFDKQAAANLAADAMKEVTWERDFAILDFSDRYVLPPGDITLGKLEEIFTKEDANTNEVKQFKITGQQLKAILRSHPCALAVSNNIRYRIENGALVMAEIGGYPIDDKEYYRGATTPFFAESYIPKDITIESNAVTLADTLAYYLSVKKTISPNNETRAVVE